VTTPAPLVRLPVSLALAVAGGLLLWLAFPPVASGLSAVLGVALVSAATWRARARRGLGVGLVAGLAFFLPLLDWMRVIGPDAWVLLALLCASWVALAGYGTALVSRLPAAPVWVAAVWVLSEALRARIPLGGFPWGNLSYAQVDTLLGDWAGYGGAAFVTAAVAVTGASLVAVALAAGRRDGRGTAGWAALAIAACSIPLLLPAVDGGDTDGGPASAVVAVVQGGTPQVGMGAMDVRRAVLDNHVAQTLDLATAIDAGAVAQPEFVLWPENSSDIDPFADQSVADSITAAARAVGVPILVGAVTEVPGNPNGVWNVGIVWDPEAGPTQMYIKTHPVPFGEYVPFRAQLAGLIGRFDRVPRDFIAGDEPGNLDVGGVAVGNVICFEIAYREVVDAVIEGGARLITVQTNNATYGGTAQPEQQLAIERLRATEFGRTVVVAATSGISAIISSDRTIVDSMGEDETGWLVAEVPLNGHLTLASRIGTIVELVLCLVAIAGIAWAGVRARRGRSSPSPRL
jgi:apolipoprotein N-acyltransferase